MAPPGDAISVSLDEIRARIDAILGERTAFPDLGAIAHTVGPAGGASRAFRAELERAARQLSLTVDAIARELSALELELKAAGDDLVERDSEVSDDVSSLQWMLGSADQAVDDAPAVQTPGAGNTSTSASDANADIG